MNYKRGDVVEVFSMAGIYGKDLWIEGKAYVTYTEPGKIQLYHCGDNVTRNYELHKDTIVECWHEYRKCHIKLCDNERWI